VQLGREPCVAQLRGHRCGARAEDRDVPGDPRPDLGDQGRSDLGQRDRENVVRPGGQALGGLVGSDYDEQVHGDMLAQDRALCIEIVEFDLSGGAGPPATIEQVFG
jgi:hypothetical protein